MSEQLPHVDEDLVARLLAEQFSDWAGLPLKRVVPGGSDNVIHRLGDELSVRLPRGVWAARQAEKENRWLPRLAPLLPLAIPEPIGLGKPGLGYPWHWSVARWLDGETPREYDAAFEEVAARDVASFLRALQGIPIGDMGEVADPIGGRDAGTRRDIAAVAGTFDAEAMTKVWDAAMDAPAWDRAPVWCHGDMHTGNLLAANGRVSAVIDFGGLAVGDPSCDLVIAWTLLSGPARETFRAELGVDDATWARGRGWALSTGLNAYVSYASTRPDVAEATTKQISAALL